MDTVTTARVELVRSLPRSFFEALEVNAIESVNQWLENQGVAENVREIVLGLASLGRLAVQDPMTLPEIDAESAAELIPRLLETLPALSMPGGD